MLVIFGINRRDTITLQQGGLRIMGKKSSDFEFRQQTSLSQRLGDKIPLLQILAGTDPETSIAIATLDFVSDPENWKLSPIKFTMGLLNARRLALLATSERFNEISKMGFMLPAKEMSYHDG